MNHTPESEKLSFSTKALYGSGTIAFGIKDHGFNALLMLFYNQVIGLPAAWVGTAIMIAMVVDAIFDPFLGQYSDNFRSRWGRRHPFMYAAALPIALSYLLLWSPAADSQQEQFIWLVTSAIIVRISISLYEIPSTALLAEFTNDYDERTKLVSSRYFFAAIGGVAMMILTFGYFLQPTPEQPVGQLNAAGYQRYAIAAAIIMFVAILVSSLGTQKQILRRPPLPAVEKTSIRVQLREMGRSLAHPAFVSILLASIFFAISTGLTMSLQLYFWTYFWELSADQIATLSSSVIVGVLGAFLIVLPLSARFGKKSAAITMILVAVTSTAIPLLLRLSGNFVPNGDPILLPLLMAQLAFTMGCTVATGILAVSMVADACDQVQLDTGKRSEGFLFSATTMVNKAISGIGIMLSGLLLSFVDFPAQAQPGQVAEEALRSLTLIFLSASSTSVITAVICLYFYPISREKHAETVKRLALQQAG